MLLQLCSIKHTFILRGLDCHDAYQSENKIKYIFTPFIFKYY